MSWILKSVFIHIWWSDSACVWMVALMCYSDRKLALVIILFSVLCFFLAIFFDPLVLIHCFSPIFLSLWTSFWIIRFPLSDLPYWFLSFYTQYDRKIQLDKKIQRGIKEILNDDYILKQGFLLAVNSSWFKSLWPFHTF